ncbi:ATP-binding cassette domain-containing protein [Enterococcus ratti]|uniref:ATP-binding cassette domain-containing protein n=1 Tax=Enterococcus ratti TaxID=150033 RepID=UPI0035184F3F
MIEVKNVSISYGKNEIFSQLSLTIEDGDFLCIYGESGSGKTTLLNLLGLLEKPDRGKIIFEGIENPKSKEVHLLQKTKIGYIFQNFGLINDESVASNLLIALETKKMNKKEKKRCMLNSLSEVGLVDILEKKVYELSGGEQQRVALARLILKKPTYIFADEPTGNLDEKNAELVFSILRKLNVKHQVTIVFVTHDKKLINFTKNTLNLATINR